MKMRAENIFPPLMMLLWAGNCTFVVETAQ